MLENKLEQQTLLAHQNTVLFMTHCGINSVVEGVFYRVPMIGMPLGFDQGCIDQNLYNQLMIVIVRFNLKNG